MRQLTDKGLAKATDEQLRTWHTELEEEIRELRATRLRVWKAIEGRQIHNEEQQAGAQVVTPEYLEADVQVNGEPVKRRWWGRR